MEDGRSPSVTPVFSRRAELYARAYPIKINLGDMRHACAEEMLGMKIMCSPVGAMVQRPPLRKCA